MARLPRSLTLIEDHCVHKIWRGHNKEWNLGTDEHKGVYLKYLNEDIESDKYKEAADINALCLMSNHGHELFGIYAPKLFSDHMRRHHSRYGIYFNKKQGRSGKVAEDRPKTCLIEGADHEMRATFYIHANPIRAGIVGDARNYYWSTHNLYAFGKREAWMRNVKLPKWYMALGRTMEQRQKRYRQLFARYLKENGNEKQDFIHKLFFGPILWMEERKEVVTKWRQEHAPPS